ncbi:hypothetical protein LTR16_001040 [Cryomyces antarcticus]|uniref:Uncharacterized protein n=1 Tax=Cryomyces antarcticus TaxID=329879 RepID=A0ABR0M1B1_9PEZI|nr:hypothetical protein LTR16_001040 [Cryomyces antarcticus]
MYGNVPYHVFVDHKQISMLGKTFWIREFYGRKGSDWVDTDSWKLFTHALVSANIKTLHLQVHACDSEPDPFERFPNHHSGTVEYEDWMLYHLLNNLHKLVDILVHCRPLTTLDVVFALKFPRWDGSERFAAAQLLMGPLKRLRSVKHPRVGGVIIAEAIFMRLGDPPPRTYINKTHRKHVALQKELNQLSVAAAILPLSEMFEKYKKLDAFAFQFIVRELGNSSAYQSIMNLLHYARVARESEDEEMFHEVQREVYSIWKSYLDHSNQQRSQVEVAFLGTQEEDVSSDGIRPSSVQDTSTISGKATSRKTAFTCTLGVVDTVNFWKPEKWKVANTWCRRRRDAAMQIQVFLAPRLFEQRRGKAKVPEDADEERCWVKAWSFKDNGALCVKTTKGQFTFLRTPRLVRYMRACKYLLQEGILQDATTVQEPADGENPPSNESAVQSEANVDDLTDSEGSGVREW